MTNRNDLHTHKCSLVHSNQLGMKIAFLSERSFGGDHFHFIFAVLTLLKVSKIN